MIARGFKPVAWVAAVGTAALGCYMLSLQVAAERAELASLERRIVATRQQIRTLHTELGTRGRLQQLEQWNAEILALSAPASGQFLESTVSLARFDVARGPAPLDSEVRLASADTPAVAAARPASPAQPAPQVRAETAARPTVRLASAEATPVSAPAVAAERPTVRRASLDVGAAPAVPPVRSAEPRRSASLLDDGTLRELRSQSRSEQGGGTRN